MDDFSQYFNSLQEASFANQIANLKSQQDEEQRQAIAPIGELISTEGIKEGISSTIESAKEMAISKAKDVAAQAMKKAGLDDETIQSVIQGNAKEAIMSKAQALIEKVKGKAEDIVSQAKSTAEDALSTAKSTAEEALSTAKTTAEKAVSNPLEVIQDAMPAGLDVASPLDGAIHMLADSHVSDLASDYYSRFGDEFDEPGDILEGTRPLFGSLRPPVMATPEDDMPPMEGTPLADMTGRAIPADLGNAGEDALGTLRTFEPDIADSVSGIASQASDVVGATTQTLSGIASTAAETVSGIAGQASSAITGAASSAADAASAISGAITGATAGEEAASAATGIASIGADVALGPLGILLGLGAGIASLVESLKKPHEQQPVNASAQFL